MQKEDAFLIARTLAGEVEAFGELVKKYQGIVFGLAFHFVKNYADAEDLTQEAFLKAYQQLRQLKNREKFSSWLRQITAKLCRNFMQRKNDLIDHAELVDATPQGQQAGLLADVMDATPTPDKVAEAHQLRQLVRHAIEKLSKPHQLTVTLFYMEGIATEEIWLSLWLHYRLPNGTTETYPMRISDETMASLFSKAPELGETLLAHLQKHLEDESGKFAKIAKSIKKSMGKAIEKAAKQAVLQAFQKHGIDAKAEDIKIGDYPIGDYPQM